MAITQAVTFSRAMLAMVATTGTATVVMAAAAAAAVEVTAEAAAAAVAKRVGLCITCIAIP